MFDAIHKKVNSYDHDTLSTLTLSGVASYQWAFIQYLKEKKENERNQIYLFPTDDAADNFYHNNKKYLKEKYLFLHLPGLESSPYSGIISSERNLSFRFRVLDSIRSSSKPVILCTSIESFMMKQPPVSFFEEYSFNLSESDIISPDELAGKLVQSGYTSSHTVEEPGTFCKKGEIFDIYPISNPPIRIHYFDEMIEEIFEIDKSTHKTIKTHKYETVSIGPAPLIFTQSKFVNNLRDNCYRPTPGEKEKFNLRKEIFSSLSNNQLFENYPVYTPLFFKETSTILDYFEKNNTISVMFDEAQTIEHINTHLELLEEDFKESREESSLTLLPHYEELYVTSPLKELNDIKKIIVNHVTIHQNLSDDNNTIDLHFESTRGYLSNHLNTTKPKKELLKDIFEFLKKTFQYSGNIVFTFQNENSKKEIEHLLNLFEFNRDIKSRIHFYQYKLPHGFFYDNEKTFIISDSDLFSTKREKVKVDKVVDYDLFAEQIASLKKGDFVIHSKHGVGEYQGLEAMDIGGSKTDYLVITYKDGDKIFVPIYKMNLIQKYADSTANVKVEDLKKNKFTGVKAKARESAKKLAFDLLRLQAERQATPSFSFSPPDHEYNEFELDFPFNETPDQKRAIENVLDKMQKPSPMDFLVCGDVGFGKTEVAMRAAFKAVEDGKQVAMLVPTTVLALQHFNSFKKRFKNFPVTIDYLSRFKSGKEEKETKENLESGKVDIIIGTHKLLSKTIKFKDLGLVIVDEEQRFGVTHKNKLKLLKATVDFLTLTATPIPRTLQLSFLGLKDLALIKTAPPRRQSIKTYLIKEDDHTIETAIRRELKRGGQVFIVHNRVNDMENYVAYIRELVPEAKIVFAHGQMAEKELEERISAFYKGTYQILVSTTIIESGIDIPNANTMIIDRADRYGLAQLHQLRGRIGRSDKKAYAYFVIPKNRNITEVAAKRLKALQTYADMGSGFQIANCDLEIRGAGDILGAQQSGHIEAIGLELYMELLTEAIQELRGERQVLKKDLEINTPFPAFIPASYIQDSSERLKFYKQLSNIKDASSIDDFKESFFDIYGPLPTEVENLFSILAARANFSPCAVKTVQVLDQTIIIAFEREALDLNEALRNRIIDSFITKTKKYSFTPDFKLIYKHDKIVSPDYLVEFSSAIFQQLTGFSSDK